MLVLEKKGSQSGSIQTAVHPLSFSYGLCMILSHLRRLFSNYRHRHYIDYLAGLNSGISAIALYPQLFSLLKGQSPVDLSILSFSLIAFNSCVWVAYGIHRRIPPLIISSTFNAIAAVGILLLMFIRS